MQQRSHVTGCCSCSRQELALFANSLRCNGASAAEGRPSVARLASSRQPVTLADLTCTSFDHTSGDVRRFTTDGLSPYRATRDDYVLKRRASLVGSAWPGARRGSVMQMVVPFPSAEMSVILPPSCCVTRLWTM